MNEFQINNPADCMAYLLIFVSGSDGELRDMKEQLHENID